MGFRVVGMYGDRVSAGVSKMFFFFINVWRGIIFGIYFAGFGAAFGGCFVCFVRVLL